jgi:hypothetical protein
MQDQLNYTPLGTVEEVHTTLWTVATKQAFPIQGPFYNIAGYLFKPTLNRLVTKRKKSFSLSPASPCYCC